MVLSAATIPNPENKHIAELLKVPLNKDGFFLEAHMKLRPVDFATDGVFLCGMAHSPKYIEESIAQACAAASRASTILSKSKLEMEGIVANVNEDLCSGCRVCEHLCAYNAVEMQDKDGKSLAHVLEALCKGCGACGTACPTKAITMGHFTTQEILAQIKAALVEVEYMSEHDEFEPKIIGFLCNWCSYAGADLAGVSRIQYPPNIRSYKSYVQWTDRPSVCS